MKIPKIVFKILKPEESSALALQHTEGRSSWQAGEILNKSHYKYLEIKTRAEVFFKLFVTHYNTYKKLIPEGLELNKDFETFLTNAIEKRMPVKKTMESINNPLYLKIALREPLIERAINELKNSKSLHAQNLYALIVEFDRYNNFRVLPQCVQEPSGFKRRNSTRFKKHLKMASKLEPYVIFRIKELYERPNVAMKNEAFVVLIDKIVRINSDEKVLKDFARISLYVFNSIQDAQTYMVLVNNYLNLEKRDPKEGLKFWPNFRNIIKCSLNYNEVHNIAPTRKSLFTAMKDLDIFHYNKNNTQKYNDKINK